MNEDTEEHGTAEPVAGPRRRGPGLGAVALLVAVAALVVAGWGIWRVQLVAKSQQSTHQQDLATIAALRGQLAAGEAQAQAGSRQIAGLAAQVTQLHNDSRGLDHRIDSLESAYATLSGQQRSGQDTALLDDAEMLLRMGQQRYELSHDVGGALKAYGQAIGVLDQVQDPAYAAVRASAVAERDALAGIAPAVPREAALAALAQLRNKVASLPLASASPATSSSTSSPGFWSRMGRAFSGIITVQRENQVVPPAGTQLARQTLALDLAQAQEALLNFDRATYRSALQQAAGVLGSQFDGHAPEVAAAGSEITKLLAEGPSAGPPPKLGAALAQLQSVRAGQSAAALPTSAASTAPAAVPAPGSTTP